MGRGDAADGAPLRPRCDAVLCPSQGGGDAVSPFSVGEESQLLPGQQEEEERLLHGRVLVGIGMAVGWRSPGRGPTRGRGDTPVRLVARLVALGGTKPADGTFSLTEGLCPVLAGAETWQGKSPVAHTALKRGWESHLRLTQPVPMLLQCQLLHCPRAEVLVPNEHLKNAAQRGKEAAGALEGSSVDVFPQLPPLSAILFCRACCGSSSCCQELMPPLASAQP